MKKKIKMIVCIVALASSVSACYRMPTEEDYSLIPATNNPAVTGERAGQLIPGVGY